MKKIASFYPLVISIVAIFVAILAYLQEISFLDLMELKTVVLAVIDEKSMQTMINSLPML